MDNLMPTDRDLDLFARTITNSFRREDVVYLADNNYISIIHRSTLFVEILKDFHYVDHSRRIDALYTKGARGHL